MFHSVNRAWCAAVVAAAVISVLSVETNSGAARADEPRAEATVTPLLTRDLTGIAGKEAIMLTVEYPPGGASRPHRHDANVFVYVLSGTLRMQVDGQEAVTVKPGETFYESPGDVHRVSANASATEPVKFLVVMVKDKGKPSTRPVGQAP
jgi:quercetin dioxygenase-like cupin family protein